MKTALAASAAMYIISGVTKSATSARAATPVGAIWVAAHLQRDQRENGADDGGDHADFQGQRGLEQGDGQESEGDGFIALRRAADIRGEGGPAEDRNALRQAQIAGLLEHDDRDKRRQRENELRRVLRAGDAVKKQRDRRKRQNAHADGEARRHEKLLTRQFDRIVAGAFMRQEIQPFRLGGSDC